MLTLDLTKQAKKFLDTLDAKRFRQVVKKTLSLLEDPHPSDSKRLKGYDFLRTDIGEYRIVYKVDNDCVYIVLIDKRNDDQVYRKIKR